MAVRDDSSAYLSALLNGACILIIEERELVQEVLHRFFQRLGAVALPARNAEQARGVASTVHPDVILCDVAMLDQNIDGLVEPWRTHARGAIVVIGLGAMPVGATLAQRAGLDGFLLKPFGCAELADTLRHIAQQRPEWRERQRGRVRSRAQRLPEATKQRAETEVTRLNAQAARTDTETLRG